MRDYGLTDAQVDFVRDFHREWQTVTDGDRNVPGWKTRVEDLKLAAAVALADLGRELDGYDTLGDVLEACAYIFGNGREL